MRENFDSPSVKKFLKFSAKKKIFSTKIEILLIHQILVKKRNFFKNLIFCKNGL